MSAARSALVEVLEGIDAIDADGKAKAAFRQLIRAVGAAHGIAAVEQASRSDFAKHLLGARVSRSTIRDRLIAHFGVSRPQAYRIIFDASHKQALDETPSGSNRISDCEG